MTVSNINWKGLKNMIEAPIFKAFRKWVAGKTFVIVLVALGIGGLWYVTHTLGELRAENATLSTQVEVLTRARVADRRAETVVEAARAETAAEYTEAAQALEAARNTAPAWANEELPPAIREALR